MSRRRQTILLTGFGPFPGVENNLSARLVRTIASELQTHFDGYHIVGDILAVEWQSALERIADLYARHQPVLAVHFGVSDHSTSIAIERRAHNACSHDPDACGRAPASESLDHAGPLCRATSLPAAAIVSDLCRQGHNATLSDDSGRYLCNAVFYHSLKLAGQQTTPGQALFVHIPSRLNPSSPAWNELIRAAQDVVRLSLASLDQPAP